MRSLSYYQLLNYFFFSSRRRHTRSYGDWSSDVCFSDLVFSRVVYAGRVDFQIGLITTYVPLVTGMLVGAIAGYMGGWIETVLMRLVDVVIAFPFLVLVIAILAIIGPGLTGLYIAVLAVGWSMYARLTRGEMLVLREQQFILAAEALGYSRRRIILRHALPNLLRPNLVFSMADFV